jgi:3-methyladenine DNA glycosylase/8-oxoguanine DNA glycosylase
VARREPPSLRASSSLRDADDRPVRLRPPDPGAPAPKPGVWRKDLWRRLAEAPRGEPVEVVAAPADHAEIRDWLEHRSAWARLRALPLAEVTDPWARAALHLVDREPGLHDLVHASRPPKILPQHPSTFASLARAIAYQQLSGRAAATIWGRVKALFPGGNPAAAALLTKRQSTLRACGLSAAKVAAVRDLAGHVVRGDVKPAALRHASDDEVVARLTRVKGIGPWSAQMHLIFALGRMDVWPTGDLGVQKGVAAWKGLKKLPTAKELEVLGEPYRPFRTLAAWYAWRAVEIGFP